MDTPKDSNTDIPVFIPAEVSDAKRNEGRSVLSEVEGVQGKGVGSGNLPEVDGPSPGDRKAAKGTRKGVRDKEKKARQQSHLRPLHFRQDVHHPNKGLDRTIGVAFKKSVMKRMELYRCDAIDALHDMAMMPLAELNEKSLPWKFEAARFLASGLQSDGKNVTSEFDSVLRQLDKNYKKNAPRIKELRERSIVFESDEPKAIN
jgi:hypothetical protein